jgi:hypothetical protein
MQNFSLYQRAGISFLLGLSVITSANANVKPKQALSLHKSSQHKKMVVQTASPAMDMMSAMHGMYGSYTMTREASGTSWEPESTPMNGWMTMTDKGMVMLQGFDNQVFDHQGGPRGSEKNFNASMFMLMAQRDLAVGTLGFRSMVSLDPQMGSSGYPLLLQTGETANGRTRLIDRQHPHDLFMELAGTYSIPIKNNHSAFIYVGLPGEPALGPPNFMMRWSGMFIPEAPITHHWLDSTHITYGVVTLGYIYNKMKLEVSSFKGREPDQSRWNIERPQLDSESVRLSYNPNDNWALQISYGHVKSPEQLEPHVNVNRTTASAIYNKPFGNQNNWQTTLAWGQDANHPGKTLNGYLLESAINFHATHTFFGRFENVRKDEFFVEPSPLTDKAFTVNKLSAGYLFEFPAWHHAKPGVGVMASTYALPSTIQPGYGNRPFSYMLFGRVSIA